MLFGVSFGVSKDQASPSVCLFLLPKDGISDSRLLLQHHACVPVCCQALFLEDDELNL